MIDFGPSSIRRLPWVAAVALAVSAGALQVHAQGSTSGTPTRPAEMQRGIPGVDIDLGTNGRAATNGVPGVDVDLRSQRAGNTNGVPGVDVDLQAPSAGNTNGVPGVDVDTRTAGAGSSGTSGMRPPIQDRN